MEVLSGLRTRLGNTSAKIAMESPPQIRMFLQINLNPMKRDPSTSNRRATVIVGFSVVTMPEKDKWKPRQKLSRSRLVSRILQHTVLFSLDVSWWSDSPVPAHPSHLPSCSEGTDPW